MCTIWNLPLCVVLIYDCIKYVYNEKLVHFIQHVSRFKRHKARLFIESHRVIIYAIGLSSLPVARHIRSGVNDNHVYL